MGCPGSNLQYGYHSNYIQGCHLIREFRENQGMLFSFRENQGEVRDFLENQEKSGKF